KPDWVTWNGYAAQFVMHPLTAMPGDTVRFWVLAAGPSLDTDFHVVGTLLDRAWVNQDMTRYQRNVRTALVRAAAASSTSRSTRPVSTPSSPTPSPASTWATSAC